MKNVIRIGDSAIGHTDILNNGVTGTVINGSNKTFSGGVGIARNGDLVYFPSHPHALDIHGDPINYQDHTIAIAASSNHKSANKKIALHGDTVPVADSAGPDAALVASQSNFKA